jgi:hypothetical protein
MCLVTACLLALTCASVCELAAAEHSGRYLPHAKPRVDRTYKPDVPLAHPPHKHSGSVVQPVVRSNFEKSIVDAEFKAPATVLLHESVFQKIVAEALPVIIDAARKMTIPGQSSEHFDFSTIKLSSFNIASFSIDFGAPNKVNIRLAGLELAVPDTDFDIKDKILFVHLGCKGHFSVSLSKTNIDVSFPLERDSQGNMAFGAGSAAVSFGDLNVNHQFDDFLCKIGQDIVQLFVGNINDLIKNLVEKDISPMATKAINDLFQKLSTSMHFPVLADPSATSDSISVTVNLLDLPKSQPALEASRPLASKFPDRDVEVFITQDSFNVVFEQFGQDGRIDVVDAISHKYTTDVFKLVLPAAYSVCPNCSLVFSLHFPAAPVVSFNNNCHLDFINAVANIQALNSTTKEGNVYTDLFRLSLNGTFAADNVTILGRDANVVDFKISILALYMALIDSHVGDVPVAAVSDIVNLILQDVVVAEFNAKFPGIPVGPIGPIGIEDVEISFDNQQLSAGFNVKLSALRK